MRLLAAALALWTLPAMAANYAKTEIQGDSFYAQDEARKATHELSLSFVLFPESGWTQDLVVEHAKGLAQTYLQCGLKISNISIFTSPDIKLPVELSKYQADGPTSLANLAAKTMDLPHPLVFLTGGFTDAEASPFSRATFIGDTKPVAPALANTLWFPMYVNSPEYIAERAHSPYSALAHELTHILTLDGEHNNDPVPNLMTIYMRRTNLLTEELCAEVLKSEFVKPIRRSGDS